MDIWEHLYQDAKPLYHPEAVNDYIYAHNVVCALQSKSGKIYTGFCVESACGTLNLCAERVALLNMFTASGEPRSSGSLPFVTPPRPVTAVCPVGPVGKRSCNSPAIIRPRKSWSITPPGKR